MTAEIAGLILAHLRERTADMVELLQQLALCESPSSDPAATARALALLAPEFGRAGLSARLLHGRSSGGMLYAAPPGRQQTRPVQILVGHADTVWPLGTLAQMPVRVEGDVLFGPGVLDMKGGLVQMVFALRALHELGLEPPADCVAFVTTDEEVGSGDAGPRLRRLARLASRAFVLEPAYGREGQLKTARKACGDFTITITGKAAHAGLHPEQGVSAVLELSHQIQHLFALNDPGRGITVNVGTIDGGLRANVVAPEVKAEVDVRVWTAEAAVAVEEAIRGLRPVDPHTSIHVTGGFAHPPMERSPRNQALWRQAQNLGKLVGLQLEQAAVGGASDGNSISQFAATLDGLGAVGDGAHATHEQVSVPQMAPRAALLALLLLAPIHPQAEAAP
jgi:glutamate carboxypeptidase